MRNNPSYENYTDVAIAISYLSDHASEQPSLKQVAQAMNLNYTHLQRIFSQWIGLSPKQFLKYISVERAKTLLMQGDISIKKTSLKSGFSSSSHLHNPLITIQAMSSRECKSLRSGKGIPITMHYSTQSSPFGLVVTASSSKGITHITFIENKNEALPKLKESFPHAYFINQSKEIHVKALKFFCHLDSHTKKKISNPLNLHLKGTPFQMKVWKCLLTIPHGSLKTYSAVAQLIGKPKASRAVGTAVRKNPVACIIPCHRVIQSSGILGNYMWGPERKKIILAQEAKEKSFKKSKENFSLNCNSATL